MSILRQITIRHLGWLYAAAQRLLYTLFVTREPAHCQWRIKATPPLLIAVAKDVKRVTCPVMKLPECCWLSVLNRCSMSRAKDTSGGLLVTGNAFGWSASWHWSSLLAAPWSRFMHLASLYQTDAEGFWVQQWYRRSNASEFNNDIEGQTFYWQFRMTVWIMVHIIYSIISDTEADD